MITKTNTSIICYSANYRMLSPSGPRTRRAKSKDKKPKDPKATADEKRPRTAFTSEQLEKLRQEFQANSYLDEKRRKDLAERLCLNENQIKIWFQNKRAKMKKQNNQPNPLRGLLVAGGLYNHSTATSDCSESYANGNDQEDGMGDEEDGDGDNDFADDNNSNAGSRTKNATNLGQQLMQSSNGNLKRKSLDDGDAGMTREPSNKRRRDGLGGGGTHSGGSESGGESNGRDDDDLADDEDERVISVS